MIEKKGNLIQEFWLITGLTYINVSEGEIVIPKTILVILTYFYVISASV